MEGRTGIHSLFVFCVYNSCYFKSGKDSFVNSNCAVVSQFSILNGNVISF